MKIPFFSRLPKPNPEKEAEYRDQFNELNLSGKDKFAMVLSAFIAIVLPCALVLLVLLFVCMFLFGVL